MSIFFDFLNRTIVMSQEKFQKTSITLSLLYITSYILVD